MAVMTLKTLVQRGVSVVRDGLAVQTRLGLGYQGNQAPAPITMRHPSPGNPGTEPGWRLPLADKHPENDVASRAGRPGCWAGVLASRSPRGASPSAAKASAAAAGADVSSRRFLARCAHDLRKTRSFTPGMQLDVKRIAARAASTASTRGYGAHGL
jgi:hypothetical protein